MMMNMHITQTLIASAVLFSFNSTAATSYFEARNGNDSNLLIVFYVQIMPDDFVMQLHRF